jgi:hypothetical protein
MVASDLWWSTRASRQGRRTARRMRAMMINPHGGTHHEPSSLVVTAQSHGRKLTVAVNGTHIREKDMKLTLGG